MFDLLGEQLHKGLIEEPLLNGHYDNMLNEIKGWVL